MRETSHDHKSEIFNVFAVLETRLISNEDAVKELQRENAGSYLTSHHCH